ncbi:MULTISPECIES: hypothetical protein [unclassified Streptomyces]|uniref:hypothetical protein n=1 Tax=unclassified Streptomyces TaxID=2593676 RepID=UPI00336ADC4C
MSQNWQQPQQPQPPQQPGGYGYPAQPPQPQPQFGGPQQQPQFAGGFPPPAPPAGRQGNPAVAVLAAVVAALVGAFLYAFLLSALADTDGQEPKITQFAYAGVAVGALVGFVIAKLGGRNPALWVVGAILALVAVFIGEVYGYAMVMSDWFGNFEKELSAAGIEPLSANEIFFSHFNSPVFESGGQSSPSLFDAWKDDADAVTWIFMALSPIAAVSTAYRLSNR